MSSRKEDRKLAGAAEKIRISTLNHPCSPEYPWRWPSEPADAAEPALEQDGACRYPMPDGLIYRHYLAQLLAEISQQCPISYRTQYCRSQGRSISWLSIQTQIAQDFSVDRTVEGHRGQTTRHVIVQFPVGFRLRYFRRNRHVSQ